MSSELALLVRPTTLQRKQQTKTGTEKVCVEVTGWQSN